jgi:ribonuclease HI
MTISHPATDTIVVYTDASRGDQCSGLGYVLTGEVSLDGKKVLMGTHTSMEAEYHALTEALRVASIESPSRTKVEAYTDCKPLVTKMRVPDDNEDWFDRRRGCHRLLNKFDDWELEYVPRGGNEKAHDLAREALFEGRERDP